MDPTGETLWATQRALAALFGVTVAAVNQHLKNIYEEEELEEEATIKKNLIVRTEGKRRVSRNVTMYNLDAILSVGYRVNSKRAASNLATAIRTVVVLLMAWMVVFITHGQTGLGSISPVSVHFSKPLIFSGHLEDFV